MQAAKLRQRRGDPDFANSAAEAIAKLLVSGELRGPLDLRGMAIETDKPIAGLPVFNLFRTHVSEVDLSCSQSEGSMSEAVFDQVHFDRSKLSHVRAAKTVFRSCTFDGATLRLNVDDARFESCSFRDASFIATASLKEWGGRRAFFTRCDFSGARFRRQEFRASTFENCIFDGCVFDQCDLRGTRFLGESPQLEQCVV